MDQIMDLTDQIEKISSKNRV
jgi:hypothetical protein